ncbi:MAG TPA: helix-turn-helix domain-containing protein [archaeon]|nr:helix-turn-helix domain-containing protein [archaeon]
MLRQHLIQKTEKILERNDYDFCEFDGCFDIAARSSEMLLIKVLVNVDSFSAEQSQGIATISESVNANPLLIGIQTRHESLKNDILYERFGVPALTPETLENMLFTDSLPSVLSRRGGLFEKINAEKLKEARESKGLTQEKLAEKIGITKKNIYEHEKNEMFASYDTIKKIEKILGNLSEPLKFNDFKQEEKKALPKTSFEKTVMSDMKKLGFSVSIVKKARFNMIGRERLMIFSDAEEDKKAASKNAPYIKGFAELAGKKALAITKSRAEMDIPSLEEKELRKMKNARELIRVVKKW